MKNIDSIACWNRETKRIKNKESGIGGIKENKKLLLLRSNNEKVHWTWAVKLSFSGMGNIAIRFNIKLLLMWETKVKKKQNLKIKSIINLYKIQMKKKEYWP